jgi:hypothetical protein
MKIWEKPPIYTLIHVVTGVVGYFFPWVLVASVLYHFLQYALDVRFFALEGTYEEGNSLEHTAVKLAEIGVGYTMVALTQN